MGLLVEGKWRDEWYDTEAHGGKFVRETAGFRNWVTVDGEAGPSGEGGFKAEAGRYHLYIAWPCPWCHRVLLYWKLFGLEEAVSVSAVDPLMLEHGWTFGRSGEDRLDPLYGSEYSHQLYTRAVPEYTGRATVPILWDKQRETIVNNESSEIMRMLAEAFKKWAKHEHDFLPGSSRAEIDETNDRVYETVNNGVYKAGFATTQDAYEENFNALFDTLDWLDARLGERRYLSGDAITEADWRLFPTLVRFDAVYFGHFKCNLRRIEDYPNLSGYLRDLHQQPGVAETVRIEETKLHYYGSHRTINPTGIVPRGPVLDFSRPHDRESSNAG
ncbi:MAG: glutathione S-transferase family protein [Gammaproteobacteria bacterium]|nr:glutathione S-transferase family protein [Gammaproteobacteria bacterium]